MIDAKVNAKPTLTCQPPNHSNHNVNIEVPHPPQCKRLKHHPVLEVLADWIRQSPISLPCLDSVTRAKLYVLGATVGGPSSPSSPLHSSSWIDTFVMIVFPEAALHVNSGKWRIPMDTINHLFAAIVLSNAAECLSAASEWAISRCRALPRAICLFLGHVSCRKMKPNESAMMVAQHASPKWDGWKGCKSTQSLSMDSHLLQGTLIH